MPKKPIARLITEGRQLRNPGRFRNRPHGGGPRTLSRPLGQPYATMSPSEVAVWHELAGSLPWLQAHHRMILRLTCAVSARIESGQMGVTAMRLLTSLLSKLGATPVDDLSHAYDDGENNEDEAFFRRQ